ncbi:hypothetical protein CIPAW_05G125600 [Carya illinoinensis]|uniref:Uncharacterized protein n=1 Tax=Carya illinoinensis TaxID=32201 RepID=A0A8T1QIZ0_CARIL|nr:hypothetical protein CIPAW_05G125600 [Carya illinoinensis]
MSRFTAFVVTESLLFLWYIWKIPRWKSEVVIVIVM